jgi:hypothetical protein
MTDEGDETLYVLKVGVWSDAESEDELIEQLPLSNEDVEFVDWTVVKKPSEQAVRG